MIREFLKIFFILAGLAAEGETSVEDPHFIERGYADILTKLRELGADIS